TSVLNELKRAFQATLAGDPGYFAPSASELRFVTMAADGADLLGARTARALGATLNLVLPYDRAEYLSDFAEPSARNLFEATLADAAAVLELPGTREEGARAYERANEFILS